MATKLREISDAGLAIGLDSAVDYHHSCVLALGENESAYTVFRDPTADWVAMLEVWSERLYSYEGYGPTPEDALRDLGTYHSVLWAKEIERGHNR